MLRAGKGASQPLFAEGLSPCYRIISEVHINE